MLSNNWEKGQKSYLFSAIGGSDDPLTKEFKKLIKHERRSWLQNKLITGIPNSRTAVTVHLSVEDEIE